MSLRGQVARRAPRVRGWPWLALLVSLVSLTASVLPAESRLAFTADGMRHGQYWRLWTGHLVHYGRAHFWGDWLAFVVWAALIESESRGALLGTVLLGAPLLLLGLEVACPTLAEYRGLSGLDTALAIELIVLRGFTRLESDGERGFGPWLTRVFGRPALRAIGVSALCLSALKILYEFYAGSAIFAHDLGQGVELLPAAHAFGALIGLGIGLIFWSQTANGIAEPGQAL